ncbi:S1C family serine protease [Microlunatus sp. Gsoil 973]|jgi:putative serine protease PepD|uniref:S1C family serine protease n=1 Tax=Microlunatus sp. Gsoil 973 TaxID=2672569 RepID=UPI0012B48D83|nr:trypsin-like peptidase domain-containing protein [Microlunatus sp. Gsoil 973]QGN34544.1 PDZ domain-containing protein [Microlunatus sp. Gsoil 973]
MVDSSETSPPGPSSGRSGSTPDPQPGQSRPGRHGWSVGVAVAALLVAGIIGGVIGALITGFTSLGAGRSGSCRVADVAARVLPAVVTISVQGQAGSGSGSGVIIDANGTVVTNDHVISAGANGGRISVILDDGTEKSARLVGRDPTTDLAVLRIDGGARLPTVSWGDSGSLVAGQPVVAAGAPLGLSGTLTSGVISALGRDVPVPTDDGSTILVGSIQTDASINPGNSGGALVTCSGELVGINTAIATVPDANGTGGGGSVGIGFAVPSSVAEPITQDLIDHGRASHPTFGMGTHPVSRSDASGREEVGLAVTSVDSGGPADEAGIRVGDIVIGVEGVDQVHADTLAHLAATSAVGARVQLTLLRDEKQQQVTVRLAAS